MRLLSLLLLLAVTALHTVVAVEEDADDIISIQVVHVCICVCMQTCINAFVCFRLSHWQASLRRRNTYMQINAYIHAD